MFCFHLFLQFRLLAKDFLDWFESFLDERRPCPLPSQHAECERCEDNFFVYRPCDEEMKNVLISRNVLQLTDRDGYKYASESDIAGFVMTFLKDIILP